MLWHAGVSENLWALAAKASVYLHNRVPHRALPDERTPYEVWHGNKPHIGHIRVWGCRACAAIPKEKRTKGDSKLSECILVGFYDTKNLYQLWNMEKKQLIKIRDVVFHEHVLGHPTLARDTLSPGWEITGNVTLSDDTEFDSLDSDDLETLYPIIESLKLDMLDCTEAVLQLSERLIKLRIPASYDAAMKCNEGEHWRSACMVEHNAMISNNVYHWYCLNDKEMKEASILPSKWLFTIKRRIDGTIEKYKARIVAGGH